MRGPAGGRLARLGPVEFDRDLPGPGEAKPYLLPFGHHPRAQAGGSPEGKQAEGDPKGYRPPW